MEFESKRIHQIFLSRPQDAPVATQWLGHFVFCGLSLVSMRNYRHPFLTSFPPGHPFLLQEGPGALCSQGGGWEPSPLLGQKELCRARRGDWQDCNKIHLCREQSYGDFLVPAAAWEWQDQAGTLCSGSFILLYPLSAPGTEAFSSIVPSLAELLRSGSCAMSPERGRVQFLNSWD